MIDEGPESVEARQMREWFDVQEQQQVARMEEGARTVIQLVTAVFSLLFGVLALSDHPEYLQQAGVLTLGRLSLLCLFGALLCSLIVVFPFSVSVQRFNISDMQRARRSLIASKAFGLRIALVLFLLGLGCLCGLVASIM